MLDSIKVGLIFYSLYLLLNTSVYNTTRVWSRFLVCCEWYYC